MKPIIKVNSKKSKQLFHITLQISNDVLISDVDNVVSVFEEYIENIIIPYVTKTDDLYKGANETSHISFSINTDQHVNKFYLHISFTFINYLYNKNNLKIKEVFKHIFSQINFKLYDNQILNKKLEENLDRYLKATEEIKINIKIKSKSLNSNEMIMSSSYSNGTTLKYLEEKQDLDELKNNFTSSWNIILNNIISKSLYIDSSLNDFISYVELLFTEINVCTKKEKMLDINYIQQKNSYEKNTMSRSYYFISFDTTQQDFSIIKNVWYDVIYSFYMNTIRLEHNIIYSPKLSTPVNNSMIITENQVNHENLQLLIDCEKEFFENIYDYVSESNLIGFKNKIKTQILNIYENGNYRTLYEYALEFGLTIDISKDVSSWYDQFIFFIDSIKYEKLNIKNIKILGHKVWKGDSNEI